MDSNTARTELLRALQARRDADGLSDSALARKLGVSKSLLSFILSGQMEPSTRVLRGIVRTYADLSPYVTLFLQSEDRIVHTQ